MSEEAILTFASSIDSRYVYLLLGLCAFIENIVPPIPGDTVTILGGYLAGIGRLSPAGVVISTTAGSFAGFMVLFFVGKVLGQRLLAAQRLYFFSRENLAKVSGWFVRFGYAVVLCNRFFSGARSVISLCAGMSHLQSVRVAILALISCLVWNMMLIVAGQKVGENWRHITAIIKQYNMVVLVLLGLLLITWGIRRCLAKAKQG